MKQRSKIFIGLCAASLAVVALTSSSMMQPLPGFTVHDLNGRYAFVISGEVTQGPVIGPLAAVGIIEADGHGNFPFATRTLTVGGQVIIQNDVATGTYTMNSNGTGTATFLPLAGGPPQTFDFAMINKHEFLATATTLGVVAQGPAYEQK
jgi:hypothetical protein